MFLHSSKKKILKKNLNNLGACLISCDVFTKRGNVLLSPPIAVGHQPNEMYE